ncbi:MAG: cytochrome c-type biogenesis protein [Thermoanaerobaculia bacterium]
MTRHSLLVVALLFVALTAFAQAPAPAAPQVPDAAQFVGPPKGAPLTGETLHVRTEQVSALLRCPVCQGLAVADSKAEMAVNMKHQVNELLARGYTEDQILSYFEQSYGQFVLLKPKFEGVNRLVWLLPIIAMLIGVGVVVVKMRNLGRGPRAEVAEPPAEVAEDPYLARVRDLVGEGKK